MDNIRISYLFQRLEEDSITIEEREELYSLLRSFENNDEILAWLEDSYKNTLPQPVDPAQWRPILERIFEAGREERKGEGNGAQVRDPESGSGQALRLRWIKWVAAACIILLVGVGTWLLVGRDTNKRRQELATTHDVSAPKETRAVITLANGTKVYLDSVDNGTIAQESNVSVVKTEDGKLVYNANSQQLTAKSLADNTLYNPRGSKAISLTLSDGTRVWLNSESSLKYPIAFAGNTREVEITGEAYFEVKHNSKQPFKVHLPNGSTVEDIGTSFNINAYPDEDAVKTTLIEGSVRVIGGDPESSSGQAANKLQGANSEQRKANSLVLKPGQQAVLNTFNLQLLTFNPDLDEVLAWKNGRFVFNKTDIQTTMRQIARWYDVEIVYKDDVKGFFSGGISRLENASQVLKMLEMTGEVHFVIEGRKITVTK